MKLRAYAPADLDALGDLWVEAWAGTGIAVDFESRRAWFSAHIAKLAAEGAHVIVAHEAEAPIGFAVVDARSGYLDQLCVALAHQGSGAARALLAEAKRRAPGVVTLKVNADNARARRFYEREGFVEAGRSVSELSGLPVVAMEWRMPLPPT